MTTSEGIRSMVSAVRAKEPGATRFHVVICGVPARISTFARASLRIGSFRPPAEAAPAVPVPHAISIMSLGDSLDLFVYALPLVPAYAPLWPLTLSGAHVITRLDHAATRLLEEACAVSGKKALDAATLVPGFSEDDEESVAALIRACVEKVVTI